MVVALHEETSDHFIYMFSMSFHHCDGGAAAAAGGITSVWEIHKNNISFFGHEDNESEIIHIHTHTHTVPCESTGSTATKDIQV